MAVLERVTLRDFSVTMEQGTEVKMQQSQQWQISDKHLQKVKPSYSIPISTVQSADLQGDKEVIG